MWVMTVKDGEVKNTDEGKEFDVQWERDGSTLVCKITGRLDTITGPELLSEYREQNTDGIQEIIMDLADTEYISSAGLRVINIISESLPDPDEFRFKNVTEDVMDILEVTGFADVYEII
jgi:anti-sigma B factor antagonist